MTSFLGTHSFVSC